jgi:hypothetical protein
MAARIGRKSASETYPQTGRGGSSAYARNSAQGPATVTAITSTASPPTQALVWQLVESGGGATANVPVTPRVTGNLKVTVVLNVNNPTGAAIQFSAVVTIGGTAVAQISQQVIPTGASDNGSLTIQPFGLTGNPLGVPVEIGVKVSGNGLTLTNLESSLFVEEVPLATG